MANLIYQFWQGQVPYYARKSSQFIKQYADKIGADYRFDENPNYFKGTHSQYNNALRPIHDEEFHKYDNVLFLDMDIFPTENISENIFEQGVKGIGIVEETQQLVLRANSSGNINAIQDNRWAQIVKNKWNIDVPRDEKQGVKVWNTGVVYYTREALIAAKETWFSTEEYINTTSNLPSFYQIDQNYLGATMFLGHTEFTELPRKWNAQIHYVGSGDPRPIYDSREEDTNFVHIQLRGRDQLTDEKIYDIVNKPINEWRHR